MARSRSGRASQAGIAGKQAGTGIADKAGWTRNVGAASGEGRGKGQLLNTGKIKKKSPLPRGEGIKGEGARTGQGPRLSLSVQYVVRNDDLPTRHQFRRWVRAALERDAPSGEIIVTLRIVDETEGRQLNRHYRGKDYATNVLTFGYGEAAEPGENSSGGALLGDIVLCAPVLAREAVLQGKNLLAHYAHLTVHGVLHMQGYDHEKTRDAGQMEAGEVEILAAFGYPDPYAVS